MATANGEEPQKRGIPHDATWSSQSRIFQDRTPANLEALFAAAPTTCSGIVFHETEALATRPTTPFMRHFLNGFMLPAMDVCARTGKNIVLNEKTAWYLVVPNRPATQAVFDSHYRDRLVLSNEDSLCLASELDLMAKTGLFLSGAGRPMANAIPDLFRMVRYMNDETDLQDPSILLRYLVVRAFLGARDFRLQYRDCLFTKALYETGPDPILTRFGEQILGTFLKLLKTGVLRPPRPEDLVGLSPVAISMNTPDATFLSSANIQQERETMDAAGRSGLLTGFNWGGHSPSSAYLPGYILDIRRHAHNFIFPTPYGFPVILPHWSSAKEQFHHVIETDGTHVLGPDGKATGLERKEEILEIFQQAAKKLLFRADNVFCIGNRLDEQTVRILLCDPNVYTASGDIVTNLRIRPNVRVAAIRDAIDDSPIAMEENTARIRVPSGLFRILDVATAD